MMLNSLPPAALPGNDQFAAARQRLAAAHTAAHAAAVPAAASADFQAPLL